MFASRVFVPMFAAAVMLRFGPDLWWVGDLGLLAMLGVGGVSSVPGWFTSDGSLWVLGGLAVLEVVAQKSPEARSLLNEVDRYAKPVAAFLTYVGITQAADLDFINRVYQGGAEAGYGEYIVGGFIAVATFLAASARSVVLSDAGRMDEDDDTGLLGLLSWGEDLWAAFGVVFLILFPLVMLILIGLVVSLLFVLRKRAEAREDRSKGDCPACHRPMYHPAVRCPHCGTPNPQPTRLNWLGASTAEAYRGDPERHALRLARHRRCPRCANRLSSRDPNAACEACGLIAFQDPAFVRRYDAAVIARLPLVLAACWGLSLIPIIGLIPGVILYRLALVAPYRRHIPRGRSMLLRLGVKVLFVLLILVQWVPVIGSLSVPLMAMLTYAAYRHAFRGLVRGTLGVESRGVGLAMMGT